MDYTADFNQILTHPEHCYTKIDIKFDYYPKNVSSVNVEHIYLSMLPIKNKSNRVVYKLRKYHTLIN